MSRQFTCFFMALLGLAMAAGTAEAGQRWRMRPYRYGTVVQTPVYVAPVIAAPVVTTPAPVVQQPVPQYQYTYPQYQYSYPQYTYPQYYAPQYGYPGYRISPLSPRLLAVPPM